jgi:oxygen-independent coproporphyrinogen-3 oxidase
MDSFDDAREIVDGYLEALLREAEIQSAAARELGAKVVTVYLGGGTPTCLSEESLRLLVTAVLRVFPVAHNAEITVEANPGTVDSRKLGLLRDIGVTRLSIGIQSLDDSLLARLGRAHSASDSIRAFHVAREAGFDNISVDLIYAIPGQIMKDWKETLDGALEFRPEHISTYGLMLEEGTPLWGDVKSGKQAPCDEDLEIDMYYLAKDKLELAGYRHYEISNFALPGYESRHNIVYWRLEPYIGLGAGAHSYVDGERRSNLTDPTDYLRSIKSSGSAVCESEAFSKADEMSTVMILGLRMVAGVSEEEFRLRFGVSMRDAFGTAIEKGLALGLLEWDRERLRLTRRGLMLSNEAMGEFL